MAVVPIQTKKGRHWQVKVRDSMGRWFPTQVFARKVDADAHEAALIAQKRQGSLAPSQEQRELTLQGYWPRWSVECRAKVSEGWKMSQDQMFRDHVAPMLGQTRLAEIRSPDIRRTLAWVRGKGLAAQTVQHVYNLMHKMFEDATDDGLVPKNPVMKKDRPEVIQRERNFLSVEDSWKLLDHSRTHWAGPAVWLSGLSALRPGEVQGLRVKALDFDRDRILIQASYNKKTQKMQEHPKQGDWGSAPMNIPELKVYLLEVTAGKSPGDFVCPNSNGGMLNYDSFCTKVLPDLCRGAGVKRVTPHELRHSCTEIWVDAGASAEDIRRLLNQKSLSATKRYIHRTDDRLNAIASTIKRPEPKPDPAPTPPEKAASASTSSTRPILRVVSSR